MFSHRAAVVKSTGQGQPKALGSAGAQLPHTWEASSRRKEDLSNLVWLKMTLLTAGGLG